MTDQVERLLVGNLRGGWQCPVRAFGDQTGAVAHGENALLALREQIGSHDHLAGAVQLQTAVGEVVGRSNTRRPDFERGGNALAAVEFVTVGIGSDDLRSRTHVNAEGAQLRGGRK